LVAIHVFCIGCTTDADEAETANVATQGTADGGIANLESSLDAAAPADDASGPVSAASTDGNPSFAIVYDSVLKKFCHQPFCHGGGSVGFDTSSKDAAYKSLVGIPANPMRECADSGLVRVAPGQPEQSLLYRKLSLSDVPCGQQMPVGGELKPELKLLIEQWIAAGAPDN
jgi:hypothetical protein